MFIIVISWNYVSLSWSLLEGSRDAGGIPALFLLKTTIPVMAVLLMLQGIAQGLRSVLVLKGQIVAIDTETDSNAD